MTAQYRIVHFVPEPFLGTRIPVAALVRRERTLCVVIAEGRMDADCLGSVAHAAALRMLLRTLGDASFEDLPATAGPHALLDEARAVPDDVDPVDWVRSFVLPRHQRLDRKGKRPRWSQYGLEFFRRHQVESYVRKRYSPQLHPDVIPALRGTRLPPVSHWVKGRDALLLMEPIVPADTRLEHELLNIATAFSAYRFQLREAPASLVAYVLPGAPPQLRERVRKELETSANLVVDLDSDASRDDFLRRIRAVGETSTGPLVH